MSNTTLTEQMIVSRTKTSDLGSVKKFNVWSTDISDVSILRKLKNLEVLSLPLNKISSLEAFRECKNLKDLSLRKNNIKDIAELEKLKELPLLERIWLEDNPFVKTCPDYRVMVLKYLPQIKVIDDKPVTFEETSRADILRRENEKPQDAGPEVFREMAAQEQSPPAPADSIYQNQLACPLNDPRPTSRARSSPENANTQRYQPEGHGMAIQRNAYYDESISRAHAPSGTSLDVQPSQAAMGIVDYNDNMFLSQESLLTAVLGLMRHMDNRTLEIVYRNAISKLHL